MEIKPKKTQDGVTIKDLSPGTPFRSDPGGNIYLRLARVNEHGEFLVADLESGEHFYVSSRDKVLVVKGAFVEE